MTRDFVVVLELFLNVSGLVVGNLLKSYLDLSSYVLQHNIYFVSNDCNHALIKFIV